MAGWRAEFRSVLLDAETVVDAVQIGENSGVAVTTHRVLVYAPDGDGATLQTVDRPNVEGVAVERSGQFLLLSQAIRAVVLGGFALVAGLLVSFDSLAAGITIPEGTGQIGISGLIGMLDILLRFLAILDDALILIGVVGLLAAAALSAVYVRSRSTSLRLTVAGEGDLTAPLADDGDLDTDALVERIEQALADAVPED